MSTPNLSNEMSEDRSEEEVSKKHMQLNLRISTTNEGSNNTLGANHVSKILIQNYASFSDSYMNNSVESVKMYLSNLKLEDLKMQPLFRVEKMPVDSRSFQ